MWYICSLLEADIVNNAHLRRDDGGLLNIPTQGFFLRLLLSDKASTTMLYFTSVMNFSGIRPELHTTFAMTHKPIWNIWALAEDALGA